MAVWKNGAIIGAPRAMIHDQGLPLFLCVEACNTIVYLQNRSSHKSLGDLTPKEAFFRGNASAHTLAYFWVCDLFSGSQGEEDQTGSHHRERNLCGIQ